jgi:hypothetical protein
MIWISSSGFCVRHPRADLRQKVIRAAIRRPDADLARQTSRLPAISSAAASTACSARTAWASSRWPASVQRVAGL